MENVEDLLHYWPDCGQRLQRIRTHTSGVHCQMHSVGLEPNRKFFEVVFAELLAKRAGKFGCLWRLQWCYSRAILLCVICQMVYVGLENVMRNNGECVRGLLWSEGSQCWSVVIKFVVELRMLKAIRYFETSYTIIFVLNFIINAHFMNENSRSFYLTIRTICHKNIWDKRKIRGN